MAVVELGDYAADKLRRMGSLIGSLRHLLIRGIDFLCVRGCAHVCLCMCGLLPNVRFVWALIVISMSRQYLQTCLVGVFKYSALCV